MLRTLTPWRSMRTKAAHRLVTCCQTRSSPRPSCGRLPYHAQPARMQLCHERSCAGRVLCSVQTVRETGVWKEPGQASRCIRHTFPGAARKVWTKQGTSDR